MKVCPPEQEEHNHKVQPPNQPNQPNQQNQSPNPFQNLPVAMANPQQLDWSYFKPELTTPLFSFPNFPFPLGFSLLTPILKVI